MPFAIEDLVKQAKSSFHSWALNLVMGSLIASQPWLGAPVIRQITQLIVGRILGILIDKGELGAFIVNSRMLTSTQAKEYREAIAQLLSLSDSSSQEEWEAVERNANEKFDHLIRLTV